MQAIKLIEDLFKNPPVSYDPVKSTFKSWAMYCLRDRGFKVIYAERGDFALELRGGEKVYFKVTEDVGAVDDSAVWIVYDPATKSTSVISQQDG